MEWGKGGRAWSERQMRVFGSQRLQAGRQRLGEQERACDAGLGNEVTAGRVERLAGILSGPQISVQEGVSRGQSKGPHPSPNILGSAGVGQGVPGLFKGSARWTDVGDHHGAAVPA